MPPKSAMKAAATKKLKYSCTACENDITSTFNAKLHPLLGCLICRKCYDIYGKGDFSKAWDDGVDEDGDDNYCRWCCDGGELFGCMNIINDTERCHHSYCKDCIKRNIPEDKILILDDLSPEEKEDMRWHCPGCDLSKIKKLRVAAELAIKKLSESDFQHAKVIKKPRENLKDTPKMNPKEAPKMNPKETPKENPKQNPKEIPRENPKEIPRENPKEIPRENPKQNPKENRRENSKAITKENPLDNPNRSSKENSNGISKVNPKDRFKDTPRENPQGSGAEDTSVKAAKRLKLSDKGTTQRLENYEDMNQAFVNELNQGFATLIEMLRSKNSNYNIIKDHMDNLQKPLDEYNSMLRDLRSRAAQIWNLK